MKAVITVTGKDSVGIIADVASVCADRGANIVDITQTVLRDYFAMIMLADIGSATVAFDQLQKNLEKVGEDNNLKIHVMHEDIFNSMHKI